MTNAWIEMKEMNRAYYKLAIMLSVVLLTGCAVNHSAYVKNMSKLDAAHYSKIKIGSPQNFTVVKMRVLDRKMQHEISNSDDPKVQAQISNYGNHVYYTDNTSAIVQKFIEVPVPDWARVHWDKYAVRDVAQTPELPNYLALGKIKITNGKQEIDDNDYPVKIEDKGDVINYEDAGMKLVFHKRENYIGEKNKNWDSIFLTKDEKYGVLRSLKKGSYKLFFRGTDGKEYALDFLPISSGLQSMKLGGYRGIVYYPQYKSWYLFDYLPTKKLICLDLARAYDKATTARDGEMTKAAFSAIALALGGFSTTTYTGATMSSYSGYYANQYWTGTGVHQQTIYAQTYDYGYLAIGTVNLLNSIFNGNASIGVIKNAMEQQQCGFNL